MKKAVLFLLFAVAGFGMIFPEDIPEDIPEDLPENWQEEMPGNQKIGWERRKQVPFVRNGGQLNRKESAIVSYIDSEVFLPAIMVEYQWALYYWLTVGVSGGGMYYGNDNATGQVLGLIKMEMSRTRDSNLFFWSWNIRTGFRYNHLDLSESYRWDDLSWVIIFDNTLALRPFQERRQVIYLDTSFIFDFDFRGDQGIDYIVHPAVLGFETILGTDFNLFLEAGFGLNMNGRNFDGQRINDNQMFPVGSLGFAYRWGGVRTAL